MHYIVGFKMSKRSEIIVIYKNGLMANNDKGVTFTCDKVVAMRVDKEITMERLKQVIAWKLRLGP